MKKPNLALLSFCIIILSILSFIFGSMTLSRIVDSESTDLNLTAASFYFSSDNLSTEGNSYVFDESLSFELYNFQDTQYTDYNIEYTVWLSDIITSGAETYTINDTNNGILQSNIADTSSIIVTPHEDIISFNLLVSPISGYKKILRSFYERPQAHTVTFDGDGGTLVSGDEVQIVEHNGDAVAPVYEKEGFLFRGWSEDITNITEDLTISAIWENYFNYDVDGNGDVTITSLNSYYNLNTLTVPETIDDNGTTRDVIAIDSSAFQYKSVLTEVNIPYGISVGNTILRGCSNLTTLTAPFDTTIIINLRYYFGTTVPGSLNTVHIAEGTTELGSRAFYTMAIESVTIADSLTIIGEEALKLCSNLQTVNISENSQLTTISEDAFYNSDLVSINLPDSLQTIGSYAFSSNTSLTNIRIPANVSSLGTNPFGGCSSLSYVIVDAPTPPTAGYSIFNNCPLLEDIYVAPAAISSYQSASGWSGTSALYTGYSEITFETNGGDLIAPITAYDSAPLPDATGREDDFSGWYTDAAFTTLYDFNTLPSTKTTVYAKWTAFPFTYTLSGSDATITGLIAEFNDTSIEVPQTIDDGGSSYDVTTISDSAFQNQTTLTSVIIPSTVTTIGTSILNGCSNLQNLTAPFKSVYNTTDNSYLGYYFGATSHSENSSTVPSSLITVNVAEGSTGLGDYAFNSCASLASVYIPDSVTSIGTSVFSYNSALAEVRLPANLTLIPSSMFSECTSLTQIDIPDTVITIASNAFAYSGLISVVIPNSVSSIETYAFLFCSALEYVYVDNQMPPTLGNNAFYYCNALQNIYLPPNYHYTYNNDNWGDLATYFSTYYLVTFETNGGNTIDPLEFIGGFGSLPTPTKSGYTFDGWFLDSGLTVPYQWSSLDSIYITVYAKWI